MFGRSSTRLLFSTVILAVFSIAMAQSAYAAVILSIPTNQTGGADTEVREFQTISDPFHPTTPGLVQPNWQAGASTELASRANDEGVESNNSDRSSVMYMKFDISGLPDHNTVPGAAYWANKIVRFRGHVRNTNLNDARIKFPTTAPFQKVTFDIRGLEPGNTYLDDGGSLQRSDRSGNSYDSPFYQYDWSEGTGTGTITPGTENGIWHGSAPGITPHCMVAGSCDTTEMNTGLDAGDADINANNIYQTLGKYDFNSDARFLGKWTWPDNRTEINVGNGLGGVTNADRYPVGLPLTYRDDNRALTDLIFDAQDAGRDTVTLMVSFGLDTRTQATGGTFPSNTFLNHNYLFIPKEMTTLSNDNAWDPDGSLTAYGGIGSPYSCSHANCNGDGTPTGDNWVRTLGNNSAGKFSPKLLIFEIPEPTSAMLLLIGAVSMLGMARRRK